MLDDRPVDTAGMCGGVRLPWLRAPTRASLRVDRGEICYRILHG
jgi:hypothetical protein